MIAFARLSWLTSVRCLKGKPTTCNAISSVAESLPKMSRWSSVGRSFNSAGPTWVNGSTGAGWRPMPARLVATVATVPLAVDPCSLVADWLLLEPRELIPGASPVSPFDVWSGRYADAREAVPSRWRDFFELLRQPGTPGLHRVSLILSCQAGWRLPRCRRCDSPF